MLEKRHLYVPTLCQIPSAPVHVHLGHHRSVYNLLTVDFSAQTATPLALVMLLVVGIIHTGVAYWLYFGSMKDLPAQTIALLSYLDPVVAILLSALFLGEPMTLLTGVGAVLVLGATAYSELKA